MKLNSSKLHRWLKGSFVCAKCGRKFSVMSFGYGKAICPNCYDGEARFIFYDKNYWLNRILEKIVKKLDTRSQHELSNHVLTENLSEKRAPTTADA